MRAPCTGPSNTSKPGSCPAKLFWAAASAKCHQTIRFHHHAISQSELNISFASSQLLSNLIDRLTDPPANFSTGLGQRERHSVETAVSVE